MSSKGETRRIERVHPRDFSYEEIIERLKHGLQYLQLNHAPMDEISASEVEGLDMALINTADRIGLDALSKMLGESKELVEAFSEAEFAVNRDTARHFVERLLQYYKEIGQQDAKDNTVYISESKPVNWVVVPKSDKLQAKIEQLTKDIQDIIGHTSFTNLSEGDRALSDAERKSLITLLETCLVMLRAPMMEEDLLVQAQEALKRGVSKVAESGTEKAFYVAGVLAIEHFQALITAVFGT